ncbi:MAG TPA: MEDS domain-containing protein [Pyrinomonadaceae bacterium]|nr:MEDS domain-containing protein [Pyrinomonadaceae bacterium]
MATELRKTGINVIGDLPWGAHFCYFYETKKDLLDILIPYFKTGLENKEFCLWIISDSELLTVEEATSALRDALPDLDRYVAERSLEIVGHDDWFLEGKTFDRYTVADRFKRKLNEALARGYAGMRVNGSPAWLSDAGPKELKRFEAELDKLFPNERTIAACTYPLATIGPDEIFDVVRTHQFAIARRQGEWEIIETQELIQAKAEIESLNEALEQRVIERTNELRVANEELRKEIIERKSAEEKFKATSEQLRALSAKLQSAKEEEATRIAREIHDELGSALTALNWDLELIEEDLNQEEGDERSSKVRVKIAAMKGVIDDTIDAIRRISAELRPSVLDDLGLVAAIRWHGREFEERTGIVAHLDSSLEDIDLTQQQSTAVFRIFEEAMTNVMRHAQATQVDIKLEKENGELELSIRDNGRGITEAEKSARRTLGLLGMRERANLIGGQVDITGSEGKGTMVSLRIPVA